ncbi:bifunctional sugar phosphate isomerase/epimerase/4-hydroxyphenylpyruvate dioxygenase family protein [Nocardia miyunensis]|uniref:bifunctional sugar phosphate isomerase/epimerase/4-hydroxyphenylpyruvate dioxygenase family protein n=1 Tax=Nocardia miyunensis TaxID=282684 RepID=UPI000A79ED1A|nr:sugar phosphate isomerase/epimerase and 4-hydroxyphenylpyruvate domain-containing protein [Nocardia miyunensis]
MTPRSIATVCLSGTLDDKLSAAAAAGFDGIELFENDLIASPLGPSRVRRRCADLGLSIDLYQPMRDIEAVPKEVFEANLRRALCKFDLMAELGVDTVLVCSSVAPHVVDNDELASEQLRVLAEHAAERGLRVAYEALAWGRHVNTWEHSWRIVRAADHPALGLCLDSFHILSRTDDAAGLAELPGDRIFFLQLADAPRLAMDVLQWSRHYRLFPGQGAFDLPAFLGYVLDAGYAGPLSLEVFNDVFRQADPHRAARDAMRSLLWLQEQHVIRTGCAEESRPPAPPQLLGHAFTELGVGGAAAGRISETLAALGFTHTGTHRSKPVQLWQQGRARILLNGTVTEHHHPDLAEIGAFAVESDDPGRSAARAEAMKAPILPRVHAPAEADLAHVAAPDGSSVFFCRTGFDGWLGDFAPARADVELAAEAPAPAGLTGVDHLGLTQPFDYFDEAALFYRAALGLDIAAETEFAAPYGLVRDRTVSNDGETLRIVLSSTLLRRGSWAPGVPDPQHVAFGTGDIFATATQLRRRGAPILDIPPNYYADLGARIGFSPAELDRMAALGIMYDRDEHGEFYHLYTELLGSRVFFEIVQRVGGYRGFGAVNAPVRMSSHRARRLALQPPA